MTKNLYVAMLIVTLIAGLIAFSVLLPMASYSIISDKPALTTGLAFAAAAAIVILAAFFTELIFKRLGDTPINEVLSSGEDIARAIGFIFAGIACAGLLGGVGQWLYNLDYQKGTKASKVADGYVFLIDNSGSMDTNDATDQRYIALENIVDELDDDIPFAVFVYDDDCLQIRDFCSKDDEEFDSSNLSYTPGWGGTDFGKVLNETLDMLEAEKNPGKVRIVLLTDGADGDFLCNDNYLTYTDRMNEDDFTLYFVALTVDDATRALMLEAAQATGGDLVEAEDAAQLGEAMTKAVKGGFTQNDDSILLNSADSILRILIRVGFLTLAGTSVALFIGLVFNINSVFKTILLEGLCKSLAGALIVQFAGVFNTVFSVLLYCLLVSTFVLGWTHRPSRVIAQPQYYSPDYSGQYNNY